MKGLCSLVLATAVLLLPACSPKKNDKAPQPKAAGLSLSGAKPPLAAAPAVGKRGSLSPAELALLKNGDIIMRRGYGQVSNLILNLLDEDIALTHCGLLSKEPAGWTVIHAESNEYINGMQQISIADFLAQSHPNTIAVARLKGAAAQGEELIHHAKDYLRRKVAFDFSFDDSDSSRLYCTELVDLSLRRVTGKSLLPLRRNYGIISGPLYANFFNAQYFETVLMQHQRATSAK